MRPECSPRSPARRRQWRLGAAVAVAVASVASAGVALAGPGGRAGAPPDSMAPAPGVTADRGLLPAADRVAFAPWLGRPSKVGGTPDGGPLAADSVYPSAVTVQNAGGDVTRFLAVFFAAEATGGCSSCRAVAAACSEPVDPGALWRVEAPPLPGDEALSAAVYSVSNAPAREGGEAWRGWLADRGYDPDSTFADVACDLVSAGAEADAAARCASYTPFRDAFIDGKADALGVPPGPMRGEAMAAVVSAPGRADLGAATLNKYAAVGPAETGATEAVTRAYVVPGLHVGTPEGFDSLLAVQNVGAACATVRVSAFLTGDGPIGPAATVEVPPGEARLVRPSALWPVQDTAALRLESDVPLAVVAETTGYDTSATHTALLQTPAPDEWFVPLAYQEERRRGDHAAGRRGPGTVAAAGGWPGGESLIAAFNPSAASVRLKIRTQADGKKDRNITIVLPGREQTVFQLGFGLGLPGGPGWARLEPLDGPAFFAVEHQRTEIGGPRVLEQWSSVAWRSRPGGATVALPDLGGPAVGPGAAVAAPGMTTSLEARIAVQNMLPSEARVAFDGRADCGPAGTITRTIEGLAALVVPARDIPGVLSGADSALIRVLDGRVAASVEIVRRERVPRGSAPPPDLTSGYTGIPVSVTLPAPALPPATLEVSPAAIVLEDPVASAAVHVGFTADGPRCLGYTAATTEPWLTVEPEAGSLPADLTLRVRRASLSPGATHAATLTVAAAGPRVGNNPVRVGVAVVVPAGRPAFLPAAFLDWSLRP